MTRKALLALLALPYFLGAFKGVAAHGWIKEPASRNLMAQGEQGFYQQMSLNR